MKYQPFVISANKAMFTLQYVVLGPDEKDLNKFFFVLEEEQLAEICPVSCRNILLTCDKPTTSELCGKSCIIQNNRYV